MAGMIGVEDADDRRIAVRADRRRRSDRATTLVARREEFGFSYVIVGAGEVDDFAPVVARLAGT